ncbi:hypothetical protein [Nonomuraea wenchangensis]|uniref:hypothetical protein n=1 Tax=Nonomuraea wenchangensis TaxID=568860 RepID=UPI00342B5F42
MTVRRRSHRMVRGVVASIVVTAAMTGTGACSLFSPGEGRPQPPPSSATVTATTWFSSLGGPKCTHSGIQWGATPISLGEGSGTTTPVAVTETATEWTAVGDRCTMSHQFSDLRPGRWRIWVNAGLATGACEADLKAGHAFVALERGTCKVTP